MGEITTKTKFQALYIDPECKKKLQYWADAAVGEVSGLGLVDNEDGRMVVREVYILEQECSGADTELDPEAISKLMMEILQADKDPAKLKFWWHSHVNMGCFWSGTDDECAETLSKEFAFSTVVNKKGESKTRLDLYEPFRITVDNIRLIEITAEDENLKKQCEQDVKEKVKTKSWTRNYNQHNNGKGYYDQKKWDNFGRCGSPYEDPYDYAETSKVKLKDDIVEDIKLLSDLIFDNGFSAIALNSFIYDITNQAIEKIYGDKAECKDGIGTYSENEKLCKKCKISKQCELLTDKLKEPLDENDTCSEHNKEDISEDSVEVIVDPDN